MTIRHFARDANGQLTNLERCAERAPEGTYEDAKQIAGAVAIVSNALIAQLRNIGLKAGNGDGLREVEAIVYAYIKASNPENLVFAAAEGFGEHVDGPHGEWMIARAASMRDFLHRERAVPGPSALSDQ